MSTKNIRLLLPLLLSLIITLSTNTAHASDKLVNYPVPEGAVLNDDYTVKIRQGKGNWQTVAAYNVKVAEMTGQRKNVRDASMAYFDFSGEVEVAITYNKAELKEARVRPLSYGIEPRVEKNTLTFKLQQPRNLSVETNGNIFHNLHLFANPIDTYEPVMNDSNLIYFAPGIHELENGRMCIPSGKTVYLAGGAFVKGQIAVEYAKNVKILGRGIIDPLTRGGIRIFESGGVYVDGVITSQCGVGNSENVTVHNVKSITQLQWGDGMNIFSSRNVLLDGVFCRNSDDCTTVYGSRGEFKGSCRNITVRNSTLWADIAHPINIGLHGNSIEPDTLEDLNFINIDILDHKEQQIDYQGCMTILAGDNNLVRNVRFENIRVEDFRQGQLVNIRITFNEKYCTAPGRGIENILFKDITYNGNNANLSVIAGYNEERKVKNIRFENLRINGLTITDDMPEKPGWYKTSDMARFFVGEHVEGIEFVK